MPVTSLERNVFIDQEIPYNSSGKLALGDSKQHAHAHETCPEEGVYEFVLPPPPEGQLLPSVAAAEGLADGGEGPQTRLPQLGVNPVADPGRSAHSPVLGRLDSRIRRRPTRLVQIQRQVRPRPRVVFGLSTFIDLR